MSKLKIVSVVFAVVLILSSVLVVQAEPFGPGHPPDGPMCPLGMLMSLNLSDSQKTLVADIINMYRDQEKALRDQLMEAGQRLQDAINAEVLNEEDVRLTFRETSPLMEEVAVLNAKMMSEIKAVLNPDQLKSLEEKRQEHIKRMQERVQFEESMSNAGLKSGSE